jgi:acetylornithine deacetylase/succinyl-diaminopimelate desuccinylase-like protein
MEAATHLKDVFDEYGISNEIIESAPGRGNIIATIGEGERSLLFLSHIDVVPAAGDWGFAPFGGEIKDGFVHGRGALDCKGLTVAEAYAMIQLASTTNLKGRLIFAATADEETGGRQGAKYLVENHKEKLMADFAINEGGHFPLMIGGKRCHFIQIGEKGTCWLRLKTGGISAHGSVPMLGSNAVLKMTEVINRLGQYQPEITLAPEVKQLIQESARFEGLSDEVNEDNLDQVIAGFKDEAFAAYLKAVTRMTVSPNVVHGGLKTNIVPDNCEAEVDIRVLPGQDKDYVVGELAPALGDADVETILYHGPSFSSSDTDSYRLVLDTFKESLGDVVILPCVSSGASDSRYLRGEGMPAYGISMLALDLDPRMTQSMHGRDEKIDIESLKLNAEILVKLAKRYLGE